MYETITAGGKTEVRLTEHRRKLIPLISVSDRNILKRKRGTVPLKKIILIDIPQVTRFWKKLINELGKYN